MNLTLDPLDLNKSKAEPEDISHVREAGMTRHWRQLSTIWGPEHYYVETLCPQYGSRHGDREHYCGRAHTRIPCIGGCSPCVTPLIFPLCCHLPLLSPPVPAAYIWITSIWIYKASKQRRTLNYLFQRGIFKLFWGWRKASIRRRWLCYRFQRRILWIMNQQDVYIFFWFSTTEH